MLSINERDLSFRADILEHRCLKLKAQSRELLFKISANRRSLLAIQSDQEGCIKKRDLMNQELLAANQRAAELQKEEYNPRNILEEDINYNRDFSGLALKIALLDDKIHIANFAIDRNQKSIERCRVEERLLQKEFYKTKREMAKLKINIDEIKKELGKK